MQKYMKNLVKIPTDISSTAFMANAVSINEKETLLKTEEKRNKERTKDSP